MTARGKREAKRNASPLVQNDSTRSTESAKYQTSVISLFQSSLSRATLTRGDAPHVFGACPWLSYCAPSGLAATAMGYILLHMRGRLLLKIAVLIAITADSASALFSTGCRQWRTSDPAHCVR